MCKLGEFRENLQESDWSYAAGYIDGEGCLAIRKQTRGRWPWYCARLSVSNTHRESLEFVTSIIGGTVRERNLLECNLKPLFNFEIVARGLLLRCLPKLLPFLRIKHRHAELMLRFVALPRGSGPDKEALYQEFRCFAEECGQAAIGRSHGRQP